MVVILICCFIVSNRGILLREKTSNAAPMSNMLWGILAAILMTSITLVNSSATDGTFLKKVTVYFVWWFALILAFARLLELFFVSLFIGDRPEFQFT